MLQLIAKTLTGPRHQLRVLSPEDREPLVEAALSAPEMFRFIPYRVAHRADALAVFDLAWQRQTSGQGVTFVNRLRQTDQLVGTTSLLLTEAAHHRIEIGSTWILPRYQRTGANTEAKWLQLRHCFDELDALRVELKTDARNARSREAMRRIGATEEGTLRAHMFTWDGHVRDSIYFSVTRAEWPRVDAHLRGLLACHVDRVA